jgi:hypothetical protein
MLDRISKEGELVPGELESSSAHLKALMGQAILSSMWTESIQHPKSAKGMWFVTGATWECLVLCNNITRITDARQIRYDGILGHFSGWPILLGPGPQYGACYVLESD